MKRLNSSIRQEPTLWLIFVLRLQKRLKFQYILAIFLFFMLAIYVHLLHTTSSVQLIITESEIVIEEEFIFINDTVSHSCNGSEIESLFQISTSNINYDNDQRPKPTIKRLYKLFQILISHEKRFQEIFDYLGVFRFNDFDNTLRPFANNTERFQIIYCLFQQYIQISDNGHIIIQKDFIDYLKRVSNYLSNGFKSPHLSWNDNSSKEKLIKPVIVLAANTLFYHTLQSSMRTINEHLKNYTVVIYDLGLTQQQLNMVR